MKLSPSGLAVLTAAIALWPQIGSAQLPARLERCLPYPTYAQEVSELGEETEPRVVFADVQFEGDIKLRKSQLAKVKALLQSGEPHATPGWEEVVAEVTQGFWVDYGYFKAKVTARPVTLSRDTNWDREKLILTVDAGRQYRVGTIKFLIDSDPMMFTESKLRNLVGMRSGEIFSGAKLRRFFDRLKQKYDALGCVDFTSVPRFDFNEATGLINIYILLDQQVQFRIGSVEILGLDPRTESELRSVLKPGELFSYEKVRRFLNEHRANLPEYWRQNEAQLSRDTVARTVSLGFDFRPCPSQLN